MSAVKQIELPANLQKIFEEYGNDTHTPAPTSETVDDVRVEIRDDFDAVRTFQRVHDMMPPIGSYARIVLDFSGSDAFSLTELSHFLYELMWHPRYEQVDLVFEGLQL